MTTEDAEASLQALDAIYERYLKAEMLPGAVFGVVRNGRLRSGSPSPLPRPRAAVRARPEEGRITCRPAVR